jgi:hypothetical protein
MNHTPFHIVCEELKMMGVVLRKGQGEYRVNSRDGATATEYVTDDLTDAVDRGREMAAQVRNRSEPPLGPTGPNRSRRSLMCQHNRKLAARRSRRQTKEN